MTDDEPQIFKTMRMGEARYIRLKNDAATHYYRIEHRDGAYSILPVKKADQPISCQQGTPLGDVPK